MSEEANPKGKGSKVPANATTGADSIVPLLLATIGNPIIDFRKMATMDELGRTESSLEHRFRKWRQKGREIVLENPEHAGALGTSNAGVATSKESRAPARKGASDKGKAGIDQAGAEVEEDETDEEARAVKQEPDETGGIGGDMLHPSVKEKATAAKSTKKRAASSQVAAAEQEVGEVTAKKAKVAKKGTARVVKKHKARVHSSSEDEDVVSEDEEKVATKPKGNGKGKVAKKRKAVGAARAGQMAIHEDEDEDVDPKLGDGRADRLVDMQFDEAA